MVNTANSRIMAEEAVHLMSLFFLMCRDLKWHTNALYFHTLYALTQYPKGSLNMSQLAENTSSTKQQTSKLVKTLEELGYVIREHDLVNRRQVYVSITELGEALVKEELEDMVTWIANEAASLSDQELQEVMDCFKVFRRLLNVE